MIKGVSVAAAAAEEGGMEEEQLPNEMSIYCRSPCCTQRDWDPRRQWRMKSSMYLMLQLYVWRRWLGLSEMN
jgi:hypothetical protein